MKRKVYSNIASKIEKLNSKRESDISQCEEIIRENEAVVKDSNCHMKTNTDVLDFITASKNKSEAEAIIKACKDKIHMLNNEGLMSSEEYDADAKAIRSEQKRICEEAFSKISKHMDESFVIYDDMFNQISEYNSLMQELAKVAHKSTGATGVVLYRDDLFEFICGTIGWLKGKVGITSYYADCKKKLN